MFSNALTQIVYYLPGIVVQLVLLGFAVLLARDHVRVAGLLAGGSVLQLLATALSFGAMMYRVNAYAGDGADIQTVALVGGAVALLANVLGALGELAVGAAAVVAVWSRVPRGGADAYGYETPRSS